MPKDITKWASEDGHFRRLPSGFRDSISREAGAKFPPAKGRYHLTVSKACPWAHRVEIVRKLKGLEDIIPMSVVHPHMGEGGWSFDGRGYEGQGSKDGKIEGTVPHPKGFKQLREIYFGVDKDYDGRFTVPCLYDTETNSIVSNESSDIIRFLNTEFDDLIDEEYRGVTYYPEKLRKEIDEINSWVYDDINNGVYKTGFANKQEAYEEAFNKLFSSLDRMEKLIGDKHFLVGDTLTEADIRLYTTIIRFDPVYAFHFKCNRDMIRSGFPNIHRWVRELYHSKETDAFSSTTNFQHIKIHYYTSHPQVNPTRIVPLGPQPHILPL